MCLVNSAGLLLIIEAVSSDHMIFMTDVWAVTRLVTKDITREIQTSKQFNDVIYLFQQYVNF